MVGQTIAVTRRSLIYVFSALSIDQGAKSVPIHVWSPRGVLGHRKMQMAARTPLCRFASHISLGGHVSEWR